MNTLLKSIIFAFALCSLQSLTAQTPTWKNITPAGWSGTFNFVEYFDGNGLLAIANNGYFYQSLDTGLTWTAYPKPVASVSWMTLYSDHKRAYICGGSHLYKTTDAAKSWQEIKWTGMPSNIDLGRIYIKTEDTLLLTASDGVNGMKIYLSPDKGLTWTMVAEKLYNGYIYGISGFYFVTPAHGYALAAGYYAETTDGGHTWTRHDVDVNTYFYGILEIQGHSTIVSTNTSDSPPVSNASFVNFGIDKIVQTGNMIYGVYGSNFFSSTDSGKTWKIKAIDANKNFESITFLDQQTGVIVGNYLTTYRTFDGGTTWTKSVHGGAEGFNKIYCKTKDECYITGKAGRLFHTTDGGTTWNYRDLSTGLQNIVFPTNDTGFISANGVVFRTIDAGANWTKFKQGTSGGFMYFPTKDTGFIGYANGGSSDIAKTTNAGQTWNTWLADMTYVNNIGFGGGGACFRSASEGLVSGENNLLYTNNGGSSWQVKATGVAAMSIIPINDNWLVVDGLGVYLCDKDINCTLKHSLKSNYNLGIPVKRDSNTIYIFQGYDYNNVTDSILISKDGGNTWKSTQDSAFSGVSFGNRNTVYSLIGGISKGIFKSQTTSSKFTQIDKQTLLCTITNDANEGYYASILLINDMLDTTVINKNIFIDNGKPLSIKIPNTIQIGTEYKIVVQPIDTIAYSTVESQSFTVTNTTIIALTSYKN